MYFNYFHCANEFIYIMNRYLLQIVNQKDPNWWQAKIVGSNGPAGLVPSQELEERRKAFVKPEADYVHKISICGTRVCFLFNVCRNLKDF